MRRYPSVASSWRERFGEKVQRVGLDAGLGCPHRDPATGRGGCVFCDPASFSPAAGSRLSVEKQLERGMRWFGRNGIRKFAAYFQAGTNTHGPPEHLRALWDAVAAEPAVVALCVGTRPDCLPDDVLDLLATYGERFGEIWLEIGLQSANDQTLKALNRGHAAADFADAVERSRARGLKVVAHVILGLPGEGEEEEAATARFLAATGAEGVKLHHLAVVRGTPLEKRFARGEISLLEPEEYARRAAAFLLRLDPKTVAHRLVGDTTPGRLVAPFYEKAAVLARIREHLEG